MYKQKRNPFNAPIVKVAMEDGVMGKANKDGTIHINKDINSPAQIKEIVKHEAVHLDQMNRGDLDYDDSNVYWKGKKYSRSKMKEGAKNLPWEKEAYTKADSPLNLRKKDDFQKRKYLPKKRLKKAAQAIGDATRSVADKIKDIDIDLKRKSKKTNRQVFKPLVDVEEQRQEANLIKEENKKPVVQATVNTSKKDTTLPTKVVKTPPPKESMASGFSVEDRVINPDGSYTYPNTSNVGNVLSHSEAHSKKGKPVTTQGINNNQLTRVDPDRPGTNLDATTDKLWNYYKGRTGPDGKALYTTKYDLRMDLKRDVSNLREQRDIAGDMFNFQDRLPLVDGTTDIRTWEDDQKGKMYVKWYDTETKDGVTTPGSYRYAFDDPKNPGQMSKFYTIDDPEVDASLANTVSNKRISDYEQSWRNSAEADAFDRKWGGSRTRNFQGEDGGGIRFNPRSATWSLQNINDGDNNPMSGFRIYQQDADYQGIGAEAFAKGGGYNNRYRVYGQ